MTSIRRRGALLGVGLALAYAPAAAADDDPEAHDPYRGMDKSGRIPAIEKPADLPHPERWRYIPEGRLKPGNFFQRFLASSFVIPFVFRNSDTGIGGGLGLTDIDFRGQRRREFAGLFVSYTTKGQASVWGLWRRWLHHREVPEGGVLQEERSFVSISGGYQKTLTRLFFGFGPDSPEDDEIKYADEVFSLDVSVQSALPEPGANLVGSIGLRAEIQQLSSDAFDCKHFAKRELSPQAEIDFALAQCPGEWDGSALFQAFIDSPEVEQLGFLTADLRWDTRDSQRNPYVGFEVGGAIDAPLVQRDNEVGALFTLNASAAFTVPPIFHDGGDEAEESPPTDTLNLGFATQMKAGHLPFTALPTLGGSKTLRAYPAGRFRDNASWYAVVEHRVWVIPRGIEITPSIRVERIGVAPFFEVGSVGQNGIDALRNEVKLSYGIGLRLLLERAAPFRVDFAWSKHGFNWSAGFGYTF